MQQKDRISSFTFCPLCKQDLKLADYNQRQRKVCPECGFVDFHNPAPAAGAIVIRDGKLLLVKRAEEPYKDCWCIPAGFVEWDESPRACTERELEEETGLQIKTGEIFDIYSGTDDPRTNAILILYFGVVTGGKAVAGDDASELAFFGREEIPSNIAFVAHRQAIKDLLARWPELLT